MLKSAFILLMSLMLTTFVFAQDATSTPAIPLAGQFTVEGQGSASANVTGTLKIEGTGPVYKVALKTKGSSTFGQASDMLVQGNVGVSLTVPDAANCAPATVLRQSDGTLFGLWIDTEEGPSSLGIEHYIPRSATTDFAGTYDLVGAYANGAQYKGTVDITKRNGENSNSLAFDFNADEKYPESIPDRARGIGFSSGNVLGYSNTFENAVQCSVSLFTFKPDGNFEGSFDLTVSGGTFTGTRQ